MKYLILILSLSITILIENGVYNIIYRNLYLNYENNTLQISRSLKEQINSNFRVINSSSHNGTSFYNILHIKTNLDIIVYENSSITAKLPSKKDKNYHEWNIVKKEGKQYLLQNKMRCYIKVRNSKIACENITIEKASIFFFIKIYEEVDYNQNNYELIEKEPIDAIIKYIDLRDPFLKRNGIHQIQKDYDNEELRYSLRSILKNIPWIRKIFIIMPNDKVRFLNDYKIIKDKIIYIKDKYILGYDSSNSLAFQFRYWKLKDFNISSNIIALDDDCFIGKHLNKSDFFYVQDRKVTPIIVNNQFIELDYIMLKKKINALKTNNIKANDEQTSAIFKYSLYSTYLFILKIFNKTKFIFPTHTHNAIPLNLNDLKEIYDLIYYSEYNYSFSASFFKNSLINR